MFVLCSEITIGGKRFRSVNDVHIKRSVNTLAATAVIKVPVTAVLCDRKTRTRIETAQAVTVGDPVEIRLGYNGRLRTEFRGYVKRLNYRTPLEIECEDEFYACRLRAVRHSGPTTLRELLQKCGLTVGYCEELTIAEFPIPDQKTKSDKVSTVLNRLKSRYLLSIWFDLAGKVYACRPASVVGATVRYRFRYNTVSEDELKYHRADDVKVLVKAVGIRRDGTIVEISVGDEGGTETKLQFYDVSNEKELRMLAAAELERRSYDGYSGTMTAFLEPFAEPAMIALMTDDRYAERSGNYFIESTEVSFGQSGGRRKVEVGLKL